jgi:hypothetical protein
MFSFTTHKERNGSHAPLRRRVSRLSCVVCSGGCPLVFLWSAGDCSPGYFCPTGSSISTQSICVAGQYSTGGNATCTNCPAGVFCLCL